MPVFNLHSLDFAALPRKAARNMSDPFCANCPAPVRPARIRRRLVLPALLGLSLLASACGRPATDEILRGGVPARTDLHQTTRLPADSIRMVARKDVGWRVIYHPDRAPANAEQGAAAALCGLERKRAREIVVLPMIAPMDDPGARMIDVICG